MAHFKSVMSDSHASKLRRKRKRSLSQREALSDDREGKRARAELTAAPSSTSTEGQVVKQRKEKKGIKKPDDAMETDGQVPESSPLDQPEPEELTLTSNKFADLNIDETIKSALAQMGMVEMLPVQQQAIPHALLGRDILGSAHTGSGKTLAFLIPALEMLIRAKFKPRNGTGVIIIAPTRELAIQIYGVAHELFAQQHQKTVALVTGGVPKENEEKKLGASMLIGTPGRLLDHLQTTRGFNYKNLKCLIIDEADRMLDAGFEEEMRSIVKLLPQPRQTLLFSATQTDKVNDLAKLSLNQKPRIVSVDSHLSVATREGLEQGYVVCSSEMRFMLLYTFLKKYLKYKIIVFFSSVNSVKYHAELLNYIDIRVMSLHGKQKQTKRSKTFFEFKNAERGILLSTDVAARGLDIPAVDWIIQYDPPDDPREYIHRVGRTARGVGTKGKALLFLLPSEIRFLKFLKEMKVPLEEYEFPPNKVANIQSQLEKLVEKIYYLHQSAKEGYKSYLLAYASHSLREVFDVHELDLVKVAKSFGLTVPPKVDLHVKTSGSSVRYGPRDEVGKKKHFSHGNFSAQNPYGKKAEGDRRQFGH